MTTASRHLLSEATVEHSTSMDKGKGPTGLIVAKRFRKLPSTDENTPRDNDFTQLDIEDPANHAAIHLTTADIGHNGDILLTVQLTLHLKIVTLKSIQTMA